MKGMLGRLLIVGGGGGGEEEAAAASPAEEAAPCLEPPADLDPPADLEPPPLSAAATSQEWSSPASSFSRSTTSPRGTGAKAAPARTLPSPPPAPPLPEAAQGSGGEPRAPPAAAAPAPPPAGALLSKNTPRSTASCKEPRSQYSITSQVSVRIRDAAWRCAAAEAAAEVGFPAPVPGLPEGFGGPGRTMERWEDLKVWTMPGWD
jgi:hypothetical protein